MRIDDLESQYPSSYDPDEGLKWIKYASESEASYYIESGAERFRNYYRPDNPDREKEIQSIRSEFFSAQCYYVSILMDDIYYTNDELCLIRSTEERIKRYLEEEKYAKAAILTISFQVVLRHMIRKTDVLAYMDKHHIRIDKCLLVPEYLDDMKLDED